MTKDSTPIRTAVLLTTFIRLSIPENEFATVWPIPQDRSHPQTQDCTHIELPRQRRHLLRVFPLRYPHTLLHLLRLGLHILPDCDELVDRSFECPDEGFRVECFESQERCSLGTLGHGVQGSMVLTSWICFGLGDQPL